MKEKSYVDYRLVFESLPQLYLVLDPEFKIVAASDAYLRATMTSRNSILGRDIFEVFPDKCDNSPGEQTVRYSLMEVLATRQPHTVGVLQYDIPRTAELGGGFEERFWCPLNSPVLDADGNVQYIVHRVEDVTEFVQLKKLNEDQTAVYQAVRDRQHANESEIFARAQEVQERSRELERVNLELKGARDQALSASRIKSEFLANMSHEIRTPMNGILGMTEIALKEQLEPRVRDHLNVIKDAGNALLNVINDILDVAKIESGKQTLEIAPFKPMQLVESVSDILQQQAASKNLSLTTFVDPLIPPALYGDPMRLRQILLNLAGNAIKFSESGEVQIRALFKAKMNEAVELRFLVKDEGAGLSAAEIEKIFKPFVQTDGSMTRKYGGTGLGLSISKSFVELMGGEIAVESVKGKGSIFRFDVTLDVATEMVQELVPPETLRGVKTLLIDDDAESRDIIGNYLEGWGMPFCQTDSGVKALDMMRLAAEGEEPYRLAIVDMRMPERSGKDVAAEIKGDSRIKDTHLLLYTAFDKPAEVELRKMGFEACLSKPVRQSHLFDCLATIMSAKPSAATKDAAESARINVSEARLRRPELILVVDDHKINQKVALLLLRDLGFEAHVASNGREAVSAVARVPYSLVFMDVQMPEMNGYESTAAIRKNEITTGRHVPVVAMTAHVLEGSREACLDAGMDDYISKPIEPLTLKTLIDKWLPATASATATMRKIFNVNNEAPVNFDALMERYGQDNVQEFLAIYLEDAPMRLEGMESAWSEKNQQEFVNVVHTFKGASGSVFAWDLQARCQALEVEIRTNGFSPEASKYFESVRASFAEVKEFIRLQLKVSGAKWQ